MRAMDGYTEECLDKFLKRKKKEYSTVLPAPIMIKFLNGDTFISEKCIQIAALEN